MMISELDASAARFWDPGALSSTNHFPIQRISKQMISKLGNLRRQNKS